MVDPIGVLGVDVAERVVRQGGKVNDRVEPLEIRGVDIPDVFQERRHGWRWVTEQAVGEQTAVEAGHRHALSLEHWYHDRANVAEVPGHQGLHATTSRT